jgi:predicted peroxiredoxin
MTSPPSRDDEQAAAMEPRGGTARPASRRLLIVLMNTDPRNVAELGAPFYHAAVAAAMDYEVDVLCTAAAGTLMHKGVAEKLCVKPGDPKTVYDWIKEAHEHGARFWACPANLELFDLSEDDLIPECRGMMGAAAMIQDIMEGGCRVLTY